MHHIHHTIPQHPLQKVQYYFSAIVEVISIASGNEVKGMVGFEPVSKPPCLYLASPTFSITLQGNR